MRSSSWMTMAASSMSRWCSASSVRSSVATTRSSAPSACSSSRVSSSWKCRRWDSGMSDALPELAGDVVLGALVVGVGEDLVGLAVLDDGAGPVPALVAQLDREERGHVGHARGLLHVVRDDHDRILALELHHQVLDPPGGDRVQR